MKSHLDNPRGYHYTLLPTGLKPIVKCSNLTKNKHMPKRKLFSKKDGTTFVQDVKGISEDVKVFFNALPLNIKKWIAEAEDIVRVLEELQKAVQDGQPADTIIDSILAKTKTDIDDRVYEWLKGSLEDLLFHIDLTLANADDIGTTKFQLASEALIEIADISRLEADTTAQIAVFLQKA